MISIQVNPELDWYQRQGIDIVVFIEQHYEKGFGELLGNRPIKRDGWQDVEPNIFNIKCKSDLLNRLLLNCSSTNWVDIENFFYQHLRQILYNHHGNKKPFLKKLNEELRFIISILEEYLLTLSIPDPSSKYSNIFKSNIKKGEITTIKLDKNQPPRNSLVINFNYTLTVAKYFNSIHLSSVSNNFDLNYIHGEINNDKNPLIFGFGDELDGDYLKMETENINEYFEYIKSFWYFKTSNYHNLIRFIESDDFQVFILGHSCGLSDRIMLNMIFEHPNCKSIKIYYHGDKVHNNFTALTQEISRHFKNKGDMRRKIVPFDKSEPMPQIKTDN